MLCALQPFPDQGEKYTYWDKEDNVSAQIFDGVVYKRDRACLIHLKVFRNRFEGNKIYPLTELIEIIIVRNEEYSLAK